MPSRAVLVAPAVLLACVSPVAACGTDIPSTRPTVTVFVDAPAGTRPSAPAPTATSARTVNPQPSPSGVPTQLAAGRQRGAPHSYAEARARIVAAPSAASVTDRFVTPSGNIVCNLGGAPMPVAACEVRSGRVTPPLPSICPPDGPKDIGRLELERTGAFPVCNSDTIREGGEPKLPYGSRTASLDPVACLSEEAGVTCVDSGSRHGFFVARSTFVTF
ncbi:hypothetical protein UB45_02335 [Terrabacter sp. 28]|jgi:hypothetical protein|nr:hypothetical protein UB45_02335 [Terrabacter sp. 28]